MEEVTMLFLNRDYRAAKSRWIEKGGYRYQNIKINDDGIFNCSEGISSRNLVFMNCHFHGSIHFKGRQKGSIIFKECQFSKEILLDLDYCSDNLSFSECQFEENLIINNGQYKDILVHALRMNQLLINAGNFKNLCLEEKSNFRSLHIPFSSVMGSINVRGVEITSLSMDGHLRKDTELLISNSLIHSIDIDDFTNEGRLKVCDTNVGCERPNFENHISVRNSNLGKAEWYNFDFGHFKTFNIYSSHIAESNFIKVNWPLEIQGFKKIEDIEEAINLISVYRQIKSTYTKQGDSISEHEFHALEMRARLYVAGRYLFKREIQKRSRQLPFFQNLQDWLVLFLSRTSSNFGLSWTRPIVFLVALSIPLFLLIVLFGGVQNVNLDISASSIFNFWQFIPHWLYYLSPIRRIEWNDIGWSIIPDILLRGIASYSIYNFIRATRRFVK